MRDAIFVLKNPSVVQKGHLNELTVKHLYAPSFIKYVDVNIKIGFEWEKSLTDM